MTARAMAAAKSADVVIYVGGIRPSWSVSRTKAEIRREVNDAKQQLEGESAKVDYQGFLAATGRGLNCRPCRRICFKALQATGKPVVFVNCSGSAMAMPWEAEHLPAIVQAWYPGEQGGRAVAEVLFGDVNPAGRLPVTFYRSTADLPAFEDYSMSNRTYRYFDGKPLFAFGHGLSYTKFSYTNAALNKFHFHSERPGGSFLCAGKFRQPRRG